MKEEEEGEEEEEEEEEGEEEEEEKEQGKGTGDEVAEILDGFSSRGEKTERRSKRTEKKEAAHRCSKLASSPQAPIE
jgi:hypothetical protein